MPRTALIAIGGNSLIRAGERGTIEEQLLNARRTAEKVARIVADGWKVVLTHGNGPQVGAALLRSERSAHEVYAQPLDVCVATTQSEIGYLLEMGLEQELRKLGILMPVMTVLTQVQLNEKDPAFQHPTKPVGPFYSKADAEGKQRTLNWEMIEDASRGYRRVVPSPEPVKVLELEIIRQMLQLGILVIALGGGGIPVFVKEDGTKVGVEAVIDKDRASAILASELGVELFIISTDVDRVYLNYRKPGQRALCKTTVKELAAYCGNGQFPAGSMGPKIESAIRFLNHGGKEVIITSCDRLVEALYGNEGTHIYP